MRAMHECRKAGCKVLLPKAGWCEQHRGESTRMFESVGRRESAARRGYGRKWRDFRREWFRDQPLCVLCGKPATELDHVIPHRGNMDLFWDEGNLQGLCKECHVKKTARGE